MVSNGSTAAIAGLGLAALAFALPSTATADEAADLAAVKAAAEKYRDINVALADGYMTPDNHCVSAASEGLPAELGSMGIHYLRPDLLGITATSPRVNGTGTHTDFMQPAILVYEPQADGSLQLVAVESLVFEKAWMDAGNTEPPKFAGQTWDRMADDPSTPADEAHAFEPHFELHLWLFKENPKGTFVGFNPTVTCDHAKGH